MPLILPQGLNARLPSQLLTLGHQRSTFRQFHASRSNQIIDEALQLSHGIFQAVHTHSGLSWGLSLALTGTLFRVAFLPINYISDRNVKRQQLYTGLLAAWRAEYQRQAIVKQRKGQLDPGPVSATSWVVEQQKRKHEVLKSKYGYRGWLKALPLCFIPVWIVNMDVIRNMVGISKNINPSVIPIEPTMVGESLLWIPDITLPDPLYILPLAVWGLNGLSYYLNFKDAPWRSMADIQKMPFLNQRVAARFAHGMRIVLGAFVTMMGPFIIYNEIASALCLYWAAGTTTLIIEKQLLKRIIGMNKGIALTVPLSARLKKIK